MRGRAALTTGAGTPAWCSLASSSSRAPAALTGAPPCPGGALARARSGIGPSQLRSAGTGVTASRYPVQLGENFLTGAVRAEQPRGARGDPGQHAEGLGAGVRDDPARPVRQ